MRDDRTLSNPHREQRLYAARIGFATLIVLTMMGVLVWRYYDLQITRHQDFATLADNNRIHVRAIAPARGLIFDRNGVLLADNRPGFTLSIISERSAGVDQLIDEIKPLIGLSVEEIERFKKLLKQRLPYEAVPLRYNLSDIEQSVLAVNEYRLSGVDVSARLVRYYPLADQLAHVVGYTGRINETELATLDSKRYRGVHTIGKTGLEKFYEDTLLGNLGYEYVETNARGRVMRVLERIDPVPGEDLHLYLDSRLQAIAMAALGDEKGAVVAIETDTGGVLALASMPSFDANLFVGGISHKDYAALVNSPDRPLFDRALRGQYPPGSTIKPIFGLAALDSGVIPLNYKVYDPGFFQLENRKHKYRDWKRGGHGGRVDIYQAIVQSCDTFFYNVGYKMGIDRLHRYGTIFGLGKPTGIDLPGEASGIMPSQAWKRGAKGVAWYPGDTVNTSIGQGFMLATPLQLAVAASRLATRGVVGEPRMVMMTEAEELAAENVQISQVNWDAVIAAMVGVVHDIRGTASRAVSGLDYKMAGKTGTAQVVGIKQDEKYDASKLAKLHLDHALFIAFAPAENPRIAVAVLVENGEHGSSTAAPVAREVIDAYLKLYPAPDAGGESG